MSGDDADARRLRRVAASLELSDRVELIGPLDHEHVPELLRSADVVACVPWDEPFGMVALEQWPVVSLSSHRRWVVCETLSSTARPVCSFRLVTLSASPPRFGR